VENYIIDINSKKQVQHGRTHVPGGVYIRVSRDPLPEDIKEILAEDLKEIGDKRMVRNLKSILFSEDQDITCFQLDKIMKKLISRKKH